MAFDMGGISATLFGLLRSFLFWGILLFILLIVTFGTLVIRQKRKLKFPAIELTDLGNGKIGFKNHKAGWFKSKTLLFGLLDYGGEDVLRLKDKRVVQNASSEDFHDINGKRGLLIARKSDDPAILVPINKGGVTSFYKKEEILTKEGKGTGKYRLVAQALDPIKKMDVTNLELLLEIAPADYRDASVKIITATEKETANKWEKFVPLLVFGTMAIIFMISIILIVQMVKQGQAEAKDLILESGRMGKDQLNIICQGLVTEAQGLPSNAP